MVTVPPVWSQSAINRPASVVDALDILPIPAQATPGDGKFVFDRGYEIVFEGYTEPRLERARLRFIERMQRRTGIRQWELSGAPLPRIVIHTKAASAPVQKLGEEEAYQLEITSSAISLSAENPLGILRGLQTILQLVHTSPEGFVAPAIKISDAPRFAWRGLMIDTGRHFMPPAVIKQSLDGMETVKLNTLHWHVSEDQGFRIESKLYPKLTGVGSDGQFYTQAEVKEIIEYARDRGIRVMPEFEMPSHANAMYVGYPELADGTGPYRLKRRFGEKWGRERKVAEDSSMDPTRETTYKFLDGLIGEMGTLFPDAYFHVGGDAEDAITEWKSNQHVKEYMQSHNMKDTSELHAYFTNRLQSIVAKHHKTMVGWDEVLQPETPKDVVIHSWRGLDSLAKAVNSGHKAILSWGYYLDLSEPASRHYTVDPFDKEAGQLSDSQKKDILGGETNMWTEYVTAETLGNRIWPRAGAVAERLWSPQSVKDVDSMYRRLDTLSQNLTYAGIPFLAVRKEMYQRMLGSTDSSALEVLAGVVEPPKGFPREGKRDYDVYSPLSHLADAVPSESDAGRKFRDVVDHIDAGTAKPLEWRQAREWLITWRDNDVVLQPMLQRSALTLELTSLSTNLSRAAAIGIAALNAAEQGMPLSAETQKAYLQTLKSLSPQESELTNAMIPGVEKLVTVAGK